MKFPFSRITSPVTHQTKVLRKKTSVFVQKKPLLSFFSLLGIIILLIILSNIITRPKETKEEITTAVKSVRVYQIGSVPKITVQAQIEKSGVIRIVALSSGVVQTIYKKEGESFSRGETLIGLSTNYQGGNIFSLQRQLAQTQYNNAADTFPTQKEIIQKQKEIAEKNDTNNDELRDISAKSIDETKSLISLNEDILNTLDENIKELEENGGDEDLILGLKQQKSQFLAATNGARSALRNTEYQTNTDKAPSQLSDLQREITIKQLEVQEKMLEVGKEISRIQLLIAQVTEGLMFPSAPFSGTVQRVFVKVGEAVQPGKELMVINQVEEDDPIVAVAYVSNEISRKISRFEPSVLHINSFTYTSFPSFISSDAVQGTLYAVYFPIPENYTSFLTEKGYISIDLPIGYSDTNAVAPFLPIDAVYQTQDQSYIFVVRNNKAESKQVKLGDVYGSFVEVTGGLKAGDQVILDRNVISDDRVTINK